MIAKVKTSDNGIYSLRFPKIGNNYLADCLFKDPIRFREEIFHMDYIDYWDFRIENVLQSDSSIVFDISFSSKDNLHPKLEGNVLIRKKDYAILQLDYTNDYEDSFSK